MSTMQQALQEVGFQPTRRKKDMQRHNLALIGREEKPTIDKMVDKVFETIARPRKVITSRAGGFVTARYEGRRAFVFGFDERHALSRLKTWDNGGSYEQNSDLRHKF
jgi:cytidylate kinase